MNELIRDIEEYEGSGRKADVCKILCDILNRAVKYMSEQGLERSEIADELGCTEDTLDYIGVEDYDML